MKPPVARFGKGGFSCKKEIPMHKLKRFKGILFVLPSLVGVMIFYMIPFLQSFMYCFTEGVIDRRFVGLSNFKALFANDAYKLAVHNTSFIVGIALPVLCSLSLVVALFLERYLEKYKGIQGILLIPMVVPTASLMLLWQDLLARDGLVNAILHTSQDWLVSDYAPWIVILLIIWKNMGYNVILILSSLLSMPREFEEAARVDGAGFWRVALWIKIPYLVPMLFFSIIISLLNCFKIFREVYLLQGDYPVHNLYLLQHFMNNHFINLNYEILTAASFLLYMVLFAIIYGMAYWQQSYMKQNR